MQTYFTSTSFKRKEATTSGWTARSRSFKRLYREGNSANSQDFAESVKEYDQNLNHTDYQGSFKRLNIFQVTKADESTQNTVFLLVTQTAWPSLGLRVQVCLHVQTWPAGKLQTSGNRLSQSNKWLKQIGQTHTHKHIHFRRLVRSSGPKGRRNRCGKHSRALCRTQTPLRAAGDPAVDEIIVQMEQSTETGTLI